MDEFMIKKLNEYNLKKSRSVGPSYKLDYERISNEMLQIIIDSQKDNGDYALDEYGAYDEWENRNYEIDIRDEYDDKDYDDKLLGMVEDKFIAYKEKLEDELMDKVHDLEYNDLVEFAGHGKYYVKSTNDNDSYEGGMIWAGPDKNDDRGWYFYVSDFVEVVEPSNSGERLYY